MAPAINLKIRASHVHSNCCAGGASNSSRVGAELPKKQQRLQDQHPAFDFAYAPHNWRSTNGLHRVADVHEMNGEACLLPRARLLLYTLPDTTRVIRHLCSQCHLSRRKPDIYSFDLCKLRIRLICWCNLPQWPSESSSCSEEKCDVGCTPTTRYKMCACIRLPATHVGFDA